MTWKQLAWRSLPGFARPAALMAYKVFDARRYYGAYVLRHGRSNPPRNLVIEVTYRCNLRCIMCPLASAMTDTDSQLVQEWSHQRELTTDEIVGLLDDGARMGIKELSLTGGEPFIRKDLLDIIRAAKARGIDCGIVSNGTLLREPDAVQLVELGLDRLQLSLDGPEEIHGQIRQSDHAFRKTMDAARWMDEAKRRARSRRPVLTLGCTISAANMEHLAPMVTLARDVHAGLRFGYLFYTTDEMVQQTNALLEVGDAKGEDQNVADELKAVDADRLYEQVCQVKQEADRLGVVARFLPDLTRDEIARRYVDDRYAYVNKCFLPWFSVSVNPYGVVYPCSMNIAMGNVREESISAIWNGANYVRFRQELKKARLFPKCAKCCALTNKLWDYLPAI